VLRRQLGLVAVTALVVGEVVAIGIFLTPAGMARSLGSPFWLLIVWLLMSVMALSGALCYGELAARTPEAGGGYVYLREAYGPRGSWERFSPSAAGGKSASSRAKRVIRRVRCPGRSPSAWRS